MSSLSDKYKKYIIGSYGEPSATFVSGRGTEIVADDGRVFLDFLSGVAVNSLGHAHPAIIKTITEQASNLIHISNYFSSKPQVELAERLNSMIALGKAKTFFSNSGAEANETALKIARKYGNAQGKQKIIAFNNSFHGRTMGTLSLTGRPKYHEGFEPLLPDIVHIDVSTDALDKAFTMDHVDNVAAVFVEIIQGEAGVIPIEGKVLEHLDYLCKKHKALLVVDEIQTGVGRTGSFFAFQQHNITPDVVTLAKGLAGGVPVGATIAVGDVADLLSQGTHGSTFGGNPLAAAVALTVIDVIIQDNLLDNVSKCSKILIDELSKLSYVDHVRGKGLLLGVVFKDNIAADLVVKCRENLLIVQTPQPNVIRLAPALLVSADDCYKAVSIIAKSFEEIKN